MIEKNRVLDLNGNPAKRKDYQGMMVDFYRREVPCCTISDGSLDFIFPHAGLLRLGNGKSKELTVFLESDDVLELGQLRRIATIDDKFRLGSTK